MSVNKVILIGNVGQEPKVTYYEGGNCVAQLSLATTDRAYTLQNGTQVPERTEWHNLISETVGERLLTNMCIRETNFMWKVRYVRAHTMTKEASSAM